MRHLFGSLLAAGFFLAGGVPGWAQDTVRLGGPDALAAISGGSTTTLVHHGGFGGGFHHGGFGGGFHHGGFYGGGFGHRGFYGGGFGYGGYRGFGYGGFYRPYYNSFIGRPFYGYGGYGYGLGGYGLGYGFGLGYGYGLGYGLGGYGLGYGLGGYGGYGAGAYGVGYGGYYPYGSAYYNYPYYAYGCSCSPATVVQPQVLSLPSQQLQTPGGSTPMPPASGGSYPYDGGPRSTVPMPNTAPVQPAPNTVPIDGKLVSLPTPAPARTRLAYPAYGEDPTTAAR